MNRDRRTKKELLAAIKDQEDRFNKVVASRNDEIIGLKSLLNQSKIETREVARSRDVISNENKRLHERILQLRFFINSVKSGSNYFEMIKMAASSVITSDDEASK